MLATSFLSASLIKRYMVFPAASYLPFFFIVSLTVVLFAFFVLILSLIVRYVMKNNQLIE